MLFWVPKEMKKKNKYFLPKYALKIIGRLLINYTKIKKN